MAVYETLFERCQRHVNEMLMERNLERNLERNITRIATIF